MQKHKLVITCSCRDY